MSQVALERMPDPRSDEAELVERARLGDQEAYGLLVRAHEQAALRVAYVIVGSATDAEDVAQEAFVKAYRALGRFRRGAPFRPWLLRIVGNEARNLRRAAGRREHHQRRAAMLESVPSAATPDDDLLARESRRRVLAALELLPEGERTAVAARYLVGLTDDEIAAALGVSRATAKMRAWRGLNRMRREAGEELR